MVDEGHASTACDNLEGSIHQKAKVKAMAMTCIVGNVQPPPKYPLSACPRRLDMVRDHLRRDWLFFLEHQEPRKLVADPGWTP
jgi:hypothetical protein